jgi:hypothetical protein
LRSIASAYPHRIGDAPYSCPGLAHALNYPPSGGTTPQRWRKTLLHLKRLLDEINKKPTEPPRYAAKGLRIIENLFGEYGWLTSAEKWRCGDKNGSHIPWYTYPATEFLSSIDFTNSTILEYGSGSSTLWWQKRSKKVYSVENDEQWHASISKITQAQKNVIYDLRTSESEYIEQQSIAEADIVIVDGAFRGKCLRYISEKILSGSASPAMIIFDNSDWYPKTMKRIGSDLGDWIQIDFKGFGPINDYTWTTSIFLSRSVDQKFLRPRHVPSIAHLKQVNPDDEI